MTIKQRSVYWCCWVWSAAASSAVIGLVAAGMNWLLGGPGFIPYLAVAGYFFVAVPGITRVVNRYFLPWILLNDTGEGEDTEGKPQS
jgi:hypothetical protein